MAINYATKYSQAVDERFKLGSFTSGLLNPNYDWVGVETVSVYSVPTAAMGDYQTTGTNRYGSPEELGNNVQELKVAEDRAFTFTIDRKSYDDTMMTMEAGKALRRQIDEVVIPEIDIYRIKTLAEGAKEEHNVEVETLTKENAYETFLTAQALLDDAKVPQGGRFCLCTPTYHNLLKQDEAFTKKGDMATQIALNGICGECDGVPFIKVPSSYFPKDVYFIITNRMVMPSPVKLQEFNIHENPPGISGWLIEGRIRYDAFVLDMKKDAIAVCKKPGE